MKMENSTKQKTRRKPKPTTTYINVNRGKTGYKDKYRRGVEKAMGEFKKALGRDETYELTAPEWKQFFKTVLIPLDGESEKRMIELFMDNRAELNQLLVLHNTKASDNLAEVYFKKYQKESPNAWYDLDDFKQYALEGLAIAAKKFDPSKGNRFLTFATWWMLNRVRKPYNDKGSMSVHMSMNSPMKSNDQENATTLEEVLGPDMIMGGWTCPGSDEVNVNPVVAIEKRNSDENYSLYSALKKMKLEDGQNPMDRDKARRMVDYLASIVDRSGSSEQRQIFLYLFRKVFSKCLNMFPDSPARLSTYISEAPKSKVELLKRLNMDEEQYEVAMKKLTRGCTYDGI